MGDEAEDVLQRVRESNYEERIKRRQEMYCKQRKLVAEENRSLTNESYSEQDIIKAARELSTNSSGSKDKLFAILKNAFIQNPSYMVSFMKVEGALHSLVGHLMSKNSVEQLLAVECCCNLSLGDSRTCFKLCKAAAPYLVNILQGLNHNLMNVSIMTIINLSGSGQKTCELLHSQGILKVLESSMNIPELRENTIKAYIILVKNGSNFLTEMEVKHLVETILPHFELSDKVQWLIYLLSPLPFVAPLLIQHEVPLRVIDLLSSFHRLGPHNILSATSLVRILGNLSADPGGITACLMLEKWDITFLIIRLFLLSKYRHLCKEVYWCLGNIIQHQNPEVQNEITRRNLDFTNLEISNSIPFA